MNFTTPVFLFVFFPITVMFYFIEVFLERRKILGVFLVKLRIKDIIIVCLSLGFYMWACFDDVFKLCIYIFMVWMLGYGITLGQRYKRTLGHVLFIMACLVVVYELVYFKYTNFFVDIWNSLFQKSIARRGILAPLGISFITFSSLSYLIDIYRKDAERGGLIDCALYLSFFPKVISGPIVLWKDFQPLIKESVIKIDCFVRGLNGIMIGFAKKLILADQFGACISQISENGVDIVTAWGTTLLYMLQIYYDFSGYSDIAIGLARLLGFEFKENFSFPYRSVSISEFWRRWHISLGTWFREYIYIPLGGSRNGRFQTLRNLAVVFITTGIWHGAGWNYIIWGGINGFCVIFERIIRDKKLYHILPDMVKWITTMGITMFCWQFFRFQNIAEVWNWMKVMFGVFQFDIIPYSWQYYFDMKIVTLIVIGIFGSTLFGSKKIGDLSQKIFLSEVGFVVKELCLLILFIMSILFMVNSTYSPFIYFQY